MRFSIIFITVMMTYGDVAVCQPKVFLPEGFSLNFGEVVNIIPVKRSITIKNSGTDTLMISNVGASCGCTALLLSDDNLGPNDSTSLLITLDARRFSGNVSKLISFNTNDKDHPLVEVKFTANIISIVQINPEYLFIKTSIDSAITRAITIENLTSDPITILSISSPVEVLSLSLSDKLLPPHGKTAITVKFDPKKEGTLSGDIFITTNHSKMQTFNIRFHSWTN